MASRGYPHSLVDISSRRIGRGGGRGKYGGLPQNVINEKYGHTKMPGDDPRSVLEEYHRSTVTDFRPDAPIYEDEMTRRDQHSEERLNVHYHGGRSRYTPDHSEMFLELTEQDPRGTQTEPDMRKTVDQARFREQRYRKHYNDDHPHIPESGRSESRLIRDRRDLFYPTKQRMKWFATGKDGRHNGGTTHRLENNDISYVLHDGTVVDPNKSGKFIHRGDQTVVLSNYLPVGWYKTTDHEFSVARYGPTYSTMNAGDIDVRRQRDGATIDHSELVEFRGNVLPKALVQVMKRISSERSATLPAHFQLSLGEELRIYKKKALTNNSKVDTTRGTQDLMAMIGAEGFNSINAASVIKRDSHGGRRRSRVDTYGEEHTLVNYARAGPVRATESRGNARFDDMDDDTTTQANRRENKNRYSKQDGSKSVNVAEMRERGDYNKHSRPLGSKKMRNYMENEGMGEYDDDE